MNKTQVPFEVAQLRKRCLAPVTDFIKGTDWYTFIDNGANILAVAHVDTVKHRRTFAVNKLDGYTCVFTPALDDRLGVYTIMDVLPALGLKFDILLTTDEEIGMSTASMFTPPTDRTYNWIFSFDRHGTGAVYYQYDRTEIATKGKGIFTTELGSFSDIAYLDDLGCAGMNIGTAYYHEHTYNCHMVVDLWQSQVAKFVHFYDKYKDTHFPYLPGGTYTRGRSNKTRSAYGYEYAYDDNYYSNYNSTRSDIYLGGTRCRWNSQTNEYDPVDTDDSTTASLTSGKDKASSLTEKIESGRDAFEQSFYTELEKDFINYQTLRNTRLLPDGETHFCDKCDGNAVVLDNSTGEYLCESCDDTRWWFINGLG